jgi:hypothetical protein
VAAPLASDVRVLLAEGRVGEARYRLRTRLELPV